MLQVRSIGEGAKKTPVSNMILFVSGTPTKKTKLVSYIDPDAGLSDDERDSGEDNDLVNNRKKHV